MRTLFALCFLFGAFAQNAAAQPVPAIGGEFVAQHNSYGGELTAHLELGGSYYPGILPTLAESHGLIGGIAGFKNRTESSFVLGGSLGYEYLNGDVFLGARARVCYYTDFSRNDWRALPEIGIHFYGLLGVWYGYAIPLQSETIPGLGRHRISVGLRIPLE